MLDIEYYRHGFYREGKIGTRGIEKQTQQNEKETGTG